MIKIDIEQLLDRLVELVEKGWRVPLTNKVMVDEERFFSIVEQMRVSVPREIQQAQELQRARDQFIARAQEEAKQILLQANEDAASQLDQYGLRERAERQAQRIIDQAWQEAEHVRAGADEYAASQLKELGRSAADLLSTVRNGLALLDQRRAEYSADNGQGPDDYAEADPEAGAEGYAEDEAYPTEDEAYVDPDEYAGEGG
ncbi:MAG: ATP synthase F0 subunit B [Chloroflexi bacterium]|nr:ATP synthase F0 subunit B [Chloroflexota bacterium]